MPTPKPFDFDESELAIFAIEDMSEQLATQPALFVNHLRIASHLSDWADSLEAEPLDGKPHAEYVEGLRTVAAHLRQGDYLEGGTFLSGR